MDIDVHIWFRPTHDLDEAAIAAVVAVLSDEERARYRRFHFERDARDYAAAHALLRGALSRDADRPPESWVFDKTPQGKPFLVERGAMPASFSLSHTPGMVACAVTSGADVGVDVEYVERDVSTVQIAERFFAPAETRALMARDAAARRDRFFDLWTLKEALLKALGTGFATPLDSLAFTIDGAGGVSLDAPPEIEAKTWQFGLFAPGPAHRLAVAVRRSGERPAQLIFRSMQ